MSEDSYQKTVADQFREDLVCEISHLVLKAIQDGARMLNSAEVPVAVVGTMLKILAVAGTMPEGVVTALLAKKNATPKAVASKLFTDTLTEDLNKVLDEMSKREQSRKASLN